MNAAWWIAIAIAVWLLIAFAGVALFAGAKKQRARFEEHAAETAAHESGIPADTSSEAARRDGGETDEPAA
ncbi:hypothetical protein ET445_16345 [Agromyces protaetiae]|uniref:Uncharacterized protein n=1 Tax=Agromyces protaetiae TaxID=2509455 RepID=A0A4P6FJ95_9MICO|nr:hypothetical protein [Agromyces protaetiae]QAY74669.1 hypothetical protein ET445_16345 [Agromyces protaetiae]